MLHFNSSKLILNLRRFQFHSIIKSLSNTYVCFQKWKCFEIIQFQGNMLFDSCSFDSQFIIPPLFILKVENSRIIPIQKFQFQCLHAYAYIFHVHIHIFSSHVHTYMYADKCMHIYTYLSYICTDKYSCICIIIIHIE